MDPSHYFHIVFPLVVISHCVNGVAYSPLLSPDTLLPVAALSLHRSLRAEAFISHFCVTLQTCMCILKAATASPILNPQVSPAQPTGGRRRRATEMDPDERRQRFLERNRAAASRCRQKRKLWVNSLEKKADDLANMNVSLTVSDFLFFFCCFKTVRASNTITCLSLLTTTGRAGNDFFLFCRQNEVTLLRNEVAQLKQLLLAHKDCPVTIMQKKAAFLGNHFSSATILLHCVTSFVTIHLSLHSSNVLFLRAHLSKGECFCLCL